MDYLAARPAWAIDVAVYALFAGLWAATLIRAGEILRDEDMPLTTPRPRRDPTRLSAPACGCDPVTLDLGLYGPDLDALEATS